MITELTAFEFWLNSGPDRCRLVSQTYSSTGVQRARGNSIHGHIPRVSSWSGDTLFYINSHLHIYFMTLLIFEVWVVDRLICQEFSFEEFFSHCTDLAPVYVILDPQEKKRQWKPPKPWDLESSPRTSSRLMPLLALKKWWGNSIVLL